MSILSSYVSRLLRELSPVLLPDCYSLTTPEKCKHVLMAV